jgi:hypothetical protein
VPRPFRVFVTLYASGCCYCILSKTSISSSANPQTLGQAVTFTAVVAAQSPGGAIPVGSVTFENGSTVLATVPLAVVNGVDEATDGSTGLAVLATLDNKLHLVACTQPFSAIAIIGFGGNDTFQLLPITKTRREETVFSPKKSPSNSDAASAIFGCSVKLRCWS